MDEIDYVRQEILDREYAESHGLYDEGLPKNLEMELHFAVSALSEIMKETNSSLSELLKKNGYSDMLI